MLNIEKYKDEIKNYIENGYDFQDTLCSIYCDKNQHDASDLDVLDWLCEERQEPILDETERKYLSAVINPFRNRVNYITKNPIPYLDREVICISYDDEYYFNLPPFIYGMYINMELYKPYTLEELGL